jgi:phospholipid/cholesterol/gamma-HCH transport system ATP-binding protein
VGVEVRVEGLTKSFGKQVIFRDVALTLPPGEVSVLLGPSGTGKSVFLKHLIGLLKPNAGHVWVGDRDVPRLSERDLYDVRKLFGVLFQDGALFGSMNLYDNVAFPLREHTSKSESEIRQIVMEKLEMVGLVGAEKKLPGELSGGMRKRAGLARALVLDPEIVLFDEPDSGLDPVRVSYLNQLIVDLNAQIGATMLIVTHDIGTARTVPDNIGLLFRRELVIFGPREEVFSSDNPAVVQFLNGRMEGPIGMAEEKDAALTSEGRGGEQQMSEAPAYPEERPAGAGQRVAEEPAPDLVDHEPDPGVRAAIALEREMAPEEGPVTGLRQPVDHETGQRLERPSTEDGQETPTTGSAVGQGPAESDDAAGDEELVPFDEDDRAVPDASPQAPPAGRRDGRHKKRGFVRTLIGRS